MSLNAGKIREVYVSKTRPQDGDVLRYNAQTKQYEPAALAPVKTLLLMAGAKVGSESGWQVNSANDFGHLGVLPQNKAGAVLVVPVQGLKIGDKILGFYPVGLFETSGNEGGLTIDLHKSVSTIDGVEEGSVGLGGFTQAEPMVMGRETALTEDLEITVGEGEGYYFQLSGTTDADMAITLQAIGLMVLPG